MTKTAFCRYFKKVTGKTFFTYLNEYRGGYACKLLMQTNLNVSEICYKSGFNSISNFNKQFKAITDTSPVRYKNKLGNET
ncbi:helix-turn-helix domain-containing protein [Fodinibius sp.]|uniref:helix-turn-helix domain-containing protein n=1 Tax=Fodinibius sp. TaxID=1872440 RepID=UPI0035689843